MVTAIVSVMTGIPTRRDVAMTGEITLRGRVWPISTRFVGPAGSARSSTRLSFSCRHDVDPVQCSARNATPGGGRRNVTEANC